MILTRRNMLTGIVAAAVAPAIIRSGVLMPIKSKLLLNDGIALTGGIPHPSVFIITAETTHFIAVHGGKHGAIVENAGMFYVPVEKTIMFMRNQGSWVPFPS